METLTDREKLNQNEILAGLKSIRFYPQPGTQAFQKLPMVERALALEYFEKDQERVDRLMAEYEAEKKEG